MLPNLFLIGFLMGGAVMWFIIVLGEGWFECQK